MPMKKERILVTVKTYPTLSKKYGETVCTAGVREHGTWVRIYPVPFCRLEESERYRKYDWLECRLVRRTADPRPESFSPPDPGQLTRVGHIAMNPLCTLRYSATHADQHHMVYRLDAVDAYERKLVKQIEVASAIVEDAHNKPYVRLVSTSNRLGTISAR